MSFKEEALALDKKNLPKHVAIIMDGNRRWAKLKKKTRSSGHREGAKRLADIVQAAKSLEIEFVTVYAFSSENWRRSKEEVKELKDLLQKFLRDSLAKLSENKIKINFIGDYQDFGSDISVLIEEIQNKSAIYTETQLNIALNYGARSEIIQAIKSLSEDEISALSEEGFSNKLYTAKIPDPDLLIRTGGEQRISNFLLWQIAYCELFFAKTLWPEFSEDEFFQIIIDYSRRIRRFGI